MIQNAFEQLQKSRELQLKEGKRVSKLCLSIVFVLSHRLRRDPLADKDGDVGLADGLLREFNRCTKNLVQNCDFELLLPLEKPELSG